MPSAGPMVLLTMDVPDIQPTPTRQLFVDNAMIARKSGVVRETHPCMKLPEPVVQGREPWEGPNVDERVYIYGTVLPADEETGYRMWYMRFRDRVLYATSEDGIHWHRPNLDLVDDEGSRCNNSLPIRLHSPSLILDPDEPDGSKRYKMLGVGEGPGGRGYCVAHSSDGLSWHPHTYNPVLTGGDTCTLARDPASGEYLAFHKRYTRHRGQDRRLVYLSTSGNLQDWSEPRLVMAPDAEDDEQTLSEGGCLSQFYNMSAFPCAGQWVGLVTHFRYSGPPPEKGPEQSPHDGPIDVQLVHSRDGRTWSRCDDRSPVIPSGPYDYDAGCILGVANQPVAVGDEVWIYYTAITTTHGGYVPRKRVTIGRASWRLDGWVSLNAGPDGGTVETTDLQTSGGNLQVNADAGRGELKVEISDPSGAPLTGYGFADCEPMRIDHVRHTILWRDRNRLPEDRPFRLRFRFRDASLFSYSIG
ncbi:MAG: hypothetical protein QGI83_01635 [Candidatus Latescibacteria bacterium]|nr:hypothetical protein [Candidatus Latescibacterota bacterium]